MQTGLSRLYNVRDLSETGRLLDFRSQNLCFRRNSEFNSDYQRLVESIGIEPTTSSLQSSRSPN